MSAPPAQAFATHLLNQTLASIGLLEQLSVISSSDAHAIRSKLPSPTGPFPSLNPPPDLSTSFGGLSVGQGHGQPGQGGYGSQSPPQRQQLPAPTGWTSPPPGPPGPSGPPALPPRGRGEQRAKALWDYTGVEQDDLSFRQNDTLIIDEEVNEQWYRGRIIPQGQSYPIERSGLFPSNYIEKIPGGAPPPQQQQQPYYQSPPSQMVQYQPPGPPQPYGYEKQSNNYGPPAPPQHSYGPPPTQQVMVQQPEEKKTKFGKIGGQLGNAAVNGAGFGFGASIASEMVHKIF